MKKVLDILQILLAAELLWAAAEDDHAKSGYMKDIK